MSLLISVHVCNSRHYIALHYTLLNYIEHKIAVHFNTLDCTALHCSSFEWPSARPRTRVWHTAVVTPILLNTSSSTAHYTPTTIHTAHHTLYTSHPTTLHIAHCTLHIAVLWPSSRCGSFSPYLSQSTRWWSHPVIDQP